MKIAKKTCAVLVLFLLCAVLFSCKGETDEKIDPIGNDGRVTVLLDAGHGFGDVGCTSDFLDGRYEYELTLDFVRLLSERLESRGFDVVLTHDGDTFPSVSELTERADRAGVGYDAEKLIDNNVFDAYERAVYANVLNAEGEIDLFLSIHVNANAESSECEGFEIDYCSENSSSRRSEKAFRSICDSLEASFGGRRRKEFADSYEMAFVVTKYTTMPSILFETAYATTPAEAERLLDPEWRAEIADALDKGIADYFSLK